MYLRMACDLCIYLDPVFVKVIDPQRDMQTTRTKETGAGLPAGRDTTSPMPSWTKNASSPASLPTPCLLHNSDVFQIRLQGWRVADNFFALTPPTASPTRHIQAK